MSAPRSASTRAAGRVRGREHHRDLRLHVVREEAGRARASRERGEHADVGDQHAAEPVVGGAAGVVEAGDDLLLPAGGRREDAARRRRAAAPRCPSAAFGRAKRLTSTRASAASRAISSSSSSVSRKTPLPCETRWMRDVEPRRLLEHCLEAARALGARDLDPVLRAVGEALRRVGQLVQVARRQVDRAEEVARLAHPGDPSLLEQRLPALEQRLQLVARGAVRGEQVDVAPVVGEPPLEVGDGLFLAPRSRPRSRSSWLGLFGRSGRGFLRGRFRPASETGGVTTLRTFCPQLAGADVVRPAAVVARIVPSSIASVRSATASSRARSWETSSTVAGKFSSAASSASRDSRSRWFVGSSRTRKFAPDATTTASASRRRSPPESTATGFSCASQPEKRKRPSRFCASGRAQAGHRLDALEHRAALVELRLVLREVRRHDAVAEPHRSARGLAGVRAASPAASSCRCRSARPARRARRARPRTRRRPAAASRPRAQRQSLRLDDVAAAPRRVEELEPEPPRPPRQQRRRLRRSRALLLQPPDLRQLRLRLLGLRLLVAEAVDEALEPRDVGVVARHRLGRVEHPRRLLAPPDVPLPGEVRRAPGVQLQDGGRRRLEEPAVVRDQDHGRVEPDQRPLEPLEPLDVEVVRRLVEQEQVRVACERARERRARQLTAGEGVQPPVELALLEPEPAQRRQATARATRSRPRARAAPGPRRTAPAFPLRARPPPSRLRADGAPPPARPGRARPRARTRAATGRARSGGRWSCSATRVPLSNTSCPPSTPVSPASMRSSVVLPAPFGPDSASRSRRSTLNETPSNEQPDGELLAQTCSDHDGHAV